MPRVNTPERSPKVIFCGWCCIIRRKPSNSEDFPRVKIGVGKMPRPDYDLAAWVLGKFPAEDQKAIDKACEDAVNAAACIIAEDCAAAAQKFNGKRI